MAIRIVRLRTPRAKGEGLRVGTVRRPPRGVKKEDYAKLDIYDVWFPTLAPSEALLKATFPIEDQRGWNSFARRFRAEMKAPEAKHALDLLAALSHHTDLAVGCYCEDASRCHRSLLEALLRERGASVI